MGGIAIALFGSAADAMGLQSVFTVIAFLPLIGLAAFLLPKKRADRWGDSLLKHFQNQPSPTAPFQMNCRPIKKTKIESKTTSSRGLLFLAILAPS